MMMGMSNGVMMTGMSNGVVMRDDYGVNDATIAATVVAIIRIIQARRLPWQLPVNYIPARDISKAILKVMKITCIFII